MKKFAFTLSEVLVTLVIVGVIAALTIPAFMNNSNNLEYQTAFKKAISGVNQALMKSIALENLTVHDCSSAEEVVSKIFEKWLQTMDSEGKSFTSDDCDGAIFVTMDGMIFCVSNFSSESSDKKGSICDFHDTTPCIASEGPNLWIDINGERNPNRLTTSYDSPKDIYQAQIYSQHVIPYGDAAQQVLYKKAPNVN